jgi:DNA mismatch repair ATPase MutS
MYHFSEQVENEKFYFNYKIQHGASTSGNAIKLLELMSYPESITTEAYKIVIDINQKF